TQPEPGEEAVIPPGQEDLLADMLGRGATLPAQCQFTAGGVERTVVKSTYACPQGEVSYELRHPSQAARGAVRTERFALSVKTGSPPEGLTDALVSRIRAKEATFEWKWLGPTPRPAAQRMIPLLAGGVMLAVVALWWVLRRR